MNAVSETKFEHYTHLVMTENGRIVEVPLRRGVDDAAFIDQISFTFHQDTLTELADKPLLSELDYMEVLSQELEHIMGFGIWKKAKTSGNRFYEHCYLMGTEEILYGKVHFGGKSQKGSVCVELTASGCKAAVSTWEKRLKRFLDDAINPRITRVDLTIDWLDGEFNLNYFEKAYLSGGFSWTNRNPKMSKVGSDWNAFDEHGNQLFDIGSGKTLYIGSRNCAKYVRIYEKGKQLGDKNSNWVRFEIEFRNRDLVITHDVLESPGTYFGGAYPICEQFTQKADRIASHKEQLEKTVEKVKNWAKTAFGGVWNMYMEYFPKMTPEEIWADLKPEHDRLPKGLCAAAMMAELDTTIYLHEKRESTQKLPVQEKLERDYQAAQIEIERQEEERIEQEEAEIWIAYERSRRNRKEAFIDKPVYTVEKINEMLKQAITEGTQLPAYLGYEYF